MNDHPKNCDICKCELYGSYEVTSEHVLCGDLTCDKKAEKIFKDRIKARLYEIQDERSK